MLVLTEGGAGDRSSALSAVAGYQKVLLDQIERSEGKPPLSCCTPLVQANLAPFRSSHHRLPPSCSQRSSSRHQRIPLHLEHLGRDALGSHPDVNSAHHRLRGHLAGLGHQHRGRSPRSRHSATVRDFVQGSIGRASRPLRSRSPTSVLGELPHPRRRPQRWMEDAPRLRRCQTAGRRIGSGSRHSSSRGLVSDPPLAAEAG